jgi:hypothetical protein
MRLLLVPLLGTTLLAQEMALPKPTPHHLALKRLEGTWDATVKVQVGPGRPPMVSKAVEVNRMVPGGLWLASEFKSDLDGIPFEGRGFFGYDPALGKHVGTWVDSMVMSLSVSEGTCVDDCRETTMFFKGPGMDGKVATTKKVYKETGPDRRTMTVYTQAKDGAFKQRVEIEYVRRK